jgi:hypothetical protein
MADWVDAKRGTDFGPKWKAKMLSERAARRVMKDAGGMIELLEGLAREIGAERIGPKAAERGDVGVIKVGVRIGRRVAFIPIGAICLGQNLWGARTHHGVFAAPCDAIAAWRV